MVKLFPVEGDSAIAELGSGDSPRAQLSLTGIDVDVVRDRRVSHVDLAVLRFRPPASADPGWWGFDLADIEDRLSGAKTWLLDNERARLPLADANGLSAAGRAIHKAWEPGET